jgi:hypothetical protein
MTFPSPSSAQAVVAIKSFSVAIIPQPNVSPVPPITDERMITNFVRAQFILPLSSGSLTP